jgi:hypothetical protein
MTVRAEHPKILDPIIIPNTVDMVDLNRERLAPPFVNSAQRAPIDKYTSPDQAVLDDLSGGMPKDAFDRKSLHARHDLPAPYGLGPGRGAPNFAAHAR